MSIMFSFSLHMAVVTKELENVKHFLSDEVYNQYKQKVDNLNQRHLIQMYDEINVAQTEILTYQVTNTDMIIKVYISISLLRLSYG